MLIALVATAAGPSTRPTASLTDQLARADTEVETAAQQLARANSRWLAVHAAVEQRAEARPDIARLNADVAEAKKRWETALAQASKMPQTGTESASSNPLNDAMKAYAAALRAHDQAVQQAIADDPELQKATRERKTTRDGFRRAKVAQLEIRSTLESQEREMSLAIREKSLAVGMTEAQAEQVMGGPGTVVAQTAHGKTLAWECTVVIEKQLVTNGSYARIVHGKVFEVWSTGRRP